MLRSKREHQHFFLLQISVGIFLILKGRFDTKGKDKAAAARVNKKIMAAVFLITIINIFIGIFSMPENTHPSEKTEQTTVQGES